MARHIFSPTRFRTSVQMAPRPPRHSKPVRGTDSDGVFTQRGLLEGLEVSAVRQDNAACPRKRIPSTAPLAERSPPAVLKLVGCCRSSTLTTSCTGCKSRACVCSFPRQRCGCSMLYWSIRHALHRRSGPVSMPSCRRCRACSRIVVISDWLNTRGGAAFEAVKDSLRAAHQTQVGAGAWMGPSVKAVRSLPAPNTALRPIGK